MLEARRKASLNSLGYLVKGRVKELTKVVGRRLRVKADMNVLASRLWRPAMAAAQKALLNKLHMNCALDY